MLPDIRFGRSLALYPSVPRCRENPELKKTENAGHTPLGSKDDSCGGVVDVNKKRNFDG
jgi:hypothetical protein